jgi:acyl-CoA synthetase (AMP-forming)/AMP-acid ligase II
MIVTPGGKNVYPEDVEGALTAVPVEELVVYASQMLFPGGGLSHGQLLAVVRPGEDDRWLDQLRSANRKLPEHKRIAGWILWAEAFPRTASMKVKRLMLADQLREATDREAIRPLLSLAGAIRG